MNREIILSFFLLLFVACGGQQSDFETEISVPVSVQEIKPQPIEEFIITTGTVNAMKKVLLHSETSGYYHLLNNPKTGKPFAIGDFVSKGQEIIHLDNPELENDIKIKSQKLNLDISKREFEKQQSLYDKGGVTLRELKDAERAYIDAQYNYENAKIQLEKLRITAPFDGLIVDLPYYTPGTKVAANSPMVKIMNYSKLYLNVNLPSKNMGKVEAGQPVRVMNYSLPDDTLRGNVTQVSPAIDQETRSFKTSIEVSNPEWLLRPGMFVKSEIIVARKDSAIVIPKDVILSKREGKAVFIVERGAARQRIISTGLENPDKVEVLEGLKENERLVIDGFETLQNRSKVKVIR